MAKYHVLYEGLWGITIYHRRKSRRRTIGKAMDRMLGRWWNATGKNVEIMEGETEWKD